MLCSLIEGGDVSNINANDKGVVDSEKKRIMSDVGNNNSNEVG